MKSTELLNVKTRRFWGEMRCPGDEVDGHLLVKDSKNCRCNIFTCTIFHQPMRANVNTCPIPVCLNDLHFMLNVVIHKRDLVHKHVFHICVHHLCALENGCIPKCYTGVTFWKWWRMRMLHCWTRPYVRPDLCLIHKSISIKFDRQSMTN